MSWAFIVTGLVTYVLNAPKFADLSLALFDAVQGTRTPFNRYANTTISSYVVSGILGLVSILVGGVAAYIHIKHVVNGPLWSGLHRTFLTSVLMLGLMYLVACVIWFVIVMNYVSSWCVGLWGFEERAAAAAGSLSQLALDGDVCEDACVALSQFPFLGAMGCVCDGESAGAMAQLASAARGKGMWVLVGVAAVCIGLIHSVVNVAADMGGTWVVINAEIVNYTYKEKNGSGSGNGSDVTGGGDKSVGYGGPYAYGGKVGSEADLEASAVTSAVNTTPATNGMKAMKSRLCVSNI